MAELFNLKIELFFATIFIVTISCASIQRKQSHLKQDAQSYCENNGASAGLKIRDQPISGAQLGLIPHTSTTEIKADYLCNAGKGWYKINYAGVEGYSSSMHYLLILYRSKNCRFVFPRSPFDRLES